MSDDQNLGAEVNALGKDFMDAMQHRQPEFFTGTDPFHGAVVMRALSTTVAAYFVRLIQICGEEQALEIMNLFSDRVRLDFEDISARMEKMRGERR